jgi:ATP-dependent Clp protease ATP-binding subunit ClpC
VTVAGRAAGQHRKAVRSMFELFTNQARQVVVLAQEEARMLQHNYVGTEHLLLGLIHEGSGVAARTLSALDISLEVAREQVTEIVGRGPSVTSGHIPFTPRAKRVLELSLRESQAVNHTYIGTEHILLGLTREDTGVGAQVLVRLGADLEPTRERVLAVLLHGHGTGEPRPARGDPAGGQRRPRPAVLGRLDQMEARLLALELRVGTQPDPADRPSLSEEVERLRSLLRQHGIEPDSGAV